MLKFKRLAILLAASVLSANAMASDHWTGWYFGANAGYSEAHSEAKATLGGMWEGWQAEGKKARPAAALSPNLAPNGAQYGEQLGYNHVFGHFLVGGELAYNRMDMNDMQRIAVPDFLPLSTPYSVPYTVESRARIDNELAARIRLGYANDRHAVYGTLGVVRVDAAFATSIQNDVFMYNKVGGASGHLGGVQIGAGYEYRLGDHWSMRTELLRTALEGVGFELLTRPGDQFAIPFAEHVERDVDYTTVRVGVNYRF